MEPQDYNLLLKTETDPKNREYSTLGEFPDEEMLKAFLYSEHNLQKFGQLRQVIDSDLGAVGFIDVYGADFEKMDCGIGIYVDKEFRRKGAACKALELIAAQLKTLGFKAVYAEVKATNSISCLLFIKAGYNAWSGDNGTMKFILTL
jgi:RimJ/RimL family protein N-acetyltransferase